MNDLKFAWRQLLKNPGFTAVAVLTLALGIGANTAIFSVVNAVLLRPLPYRNPETLVWIFRENPSLGHKQVVLTPGRFLALQEQTRSLSEIATVEPQDFALIGEGKAEQLQGVRVSVNLAEVLGIRPQLGRTFLPGENEPGHHRVALISHRLWQRRFGGESQAIGKIIRNEIDSFTIVGVLPPGLEFPLGTLAGPHGVIKEGADIWIPAALSAEQRSGKTVDFLGSNGAAFVLARLKPGVTSGLASAELQTITTAWEESQKIKMPAGWNVRAISVKDQLAGASRSILFLLLGAVWLVLLIACVNVANLFLIRGSVRHREMAVRLALGASRLRVIRQLLTESVLFALVGGLAGVLLAFLGVKMLIPLLPADLPRLHEAVIDVPVLGFTAACSVLAGLLFGLAPAIQAARVGLNDTLKDNNRGLAGGLQHRPLRSALVIAEIAVSLTLLAGAGLLIRSSIRLNQVDPGFEMDHVLAVNLSLSPIRYPDQMAREAFTRQMIERLEALPGVSSAAASMGLPFAGGRLFTNQRLLLDGQPTPPPGSEQWIRLRGVSPHYFRTMGTPLLKGRDFTAHDETNEVIVVNESFARTFCAGSEPVGVRCNLGEIIGVVKDSRDIALEIAAEPRVYTPTYGFLLQSILVRTTGDPGRMIAAVEQEVSALDKDQPIQSIRSLKQVVSESVARRRSQTALLALLAATALALAAIGIYGVMAALVHERIHEIGVRMALGAQKRDVLRLVVGQGMRLALIGLAFGLAGAFGLTHFIQSQLYEVGSADPIAFGSVSLLLTTMALLACCLAARCATQVDPMEALRNG